MPTSTSKAYFIAGSFMDVNVFYSPRHLTFIIVYLTIYADSTFYYRYLEADQGILPPFAPGGDSSSDYVETILKYNWSEQQVLYKAAQGLSGKYIYSGGPHLGYYGSNDIINGDRLGLRTALLPPAFLWSVCQSCNSCGRGRSSGYACGYPTSNLSCCLCFNLTFTSVLGRDHNKASIRPLADLAMPIIAHVKNVLLLAVSVVIFFPLVDI